MRNPLSIALFTLMLSPLAAFAQQQYATPEQAAQITGRYQALLRQLTDADAPGAGNP